MASTSRIPQNPLISIELLSQRLSFLSLESTSTQIASSTSSSIPRWTYDAFLSFHGEDTRNSFTDHLHYVLKQKGFNVFRDAEKLERGEYVGDELLKAIQESMNAIVVISANYASSRWCLIELAEIVERMRGTNLKVLPVFYHVDPSDVRNQTGTFAEAFARHEKDPKVDDDKMQKWKAALKVVGNIAGWHVDDGPESVVVEEISRKIRCGSSHNFSNVSKGLVGIKSRMEEMESILGMGLDDVRFLGICGMGGIGKTTLAKVIYESIAYKFEASCFIPNIREQTKKHGLLYLQIQLISQILGESETNIQINTCVATSLIANRIRQRRVLIILDDMDGDEQVQALAGSDDWFGQGSRIIITSRDLHFLNRLGVNTYKVKKLNNEEALELFSWKAFNKPHLEKNCVELSKDIVSYAQGLPLALTIFGSMLFDRKMEAWKSARDLLKESPSAEILDKLRISYDGLEDTQKDLFLDFACFYNGANMDSIKHKLESFGYYPNYNTEVLEGKSLITISEFGSLEMHDLLQKMGQKIVHDESAEPGKRSRLCHNKDVIHVLKNDTGTDAVKGIDLKLPLKKPERLNVEAFSKMKKLKMLQIGYHYFAYDDNLCTNLEWHGDASNFMLSNELCVMEWWRYPLESLPTNFQSDNLVELIMHESCIKQLWVGGNSFDKLKHIDLSESQNLIETPDLSGVPNLEKLELSYCTNLSKVHRSIGFLRRLKELNLIYCKHLKRLPDEMISLESLEHLNLFGCSRLNKIPDSVGNMTSLRYLVLYKTAIKKLPLSLKRLSSLKVLNIFYCLRLEKIPKNLLSGMKCLEVLKVGGSATREFPIGSGPDPMISLLLPNSFSCLSSLRELNLSYCNLSDGAILNDLSCLSLLSKLNLSYCNLSDGAILNDLSCLSLLSKLNLSGNKFTRIPDSVAQLSNLHQLELDNCSWLQVLPKLPLRLTCLSVRNCPLLELFYNKQMEMWRSSNEKLRSIDCSVVQAYFDYDGNPFNILHLHPQSPLWSEESSGYFCPEVACGPALVGSGIPEWFNDKSTNSFGTIQLHSDLERLDKWWKWNGYALFIVYEFHEPHTTHPRKRRKLKVDERKGNSNSTTIFDGSNSNFPNFVCQFQCLVNGVDVTIVTKPLVFFAPEVPYVGPNGFWVYIPFYWFLAEMASNYWELLGSIKASITTGSLNVEVKECGARLVRDDKLDASALYQVLNTISPRALGFKSYEKLFSHMCIPIRPYLDIGGPIKSNVVASGSIESVNCQRIKIRLKRNRSMGIKIKQKMLTFPSQRIRREPTKKRRRIALE